MKRAEVKKIQTPPQTTRLVRDTKQWCMKDALTFWKILEKILEKLENLEYCSPSAWGNICTEIHPLQRHSSKRNHMRPGRAGKMALQHLK